MDCVSCRTDVLPIYLKRGYKEVARYPVETFIKEKRLTRPNLDMIILIKGDLGPNYKYKPEFEIVQKCTSVTILSLFWSVTKE